MAKKYNFFEELTNEFISNNTEDVVDPISFIESPWGISFKLFPQQRFVIKCFYGMELDDQRRDIVVRDETNENLINTFTEVEFLQWLHDQNLVNTDKIKDKKFRELILITGRRGGKCLSIDDFIDTTIGTLTYGELLERKNNNEKIGINTYDPETLKRFVTYDFKIWSNGNKPCYELKTKTGLIQNATDNHPFLIWKNEKPEFIELKDVKIGDRIAIAREGNINERLHRQYSPNRIRVENYANNINDKFLKDMGCSDVDWDIVESIQAIGIKPTVDLEVKNTHIVGGNILSHNSSICSAIGCYELYKLIKRGDPSNFYGFPPDTKINIIAAAPTDEQARVVFDMMMGHVLRSPYLKDRSVNQTQTYFNLQTDIDMAEKRRKKRASLNVITGGCSSNSLRGPNNIVVIMDEMAFFIDNNGRFSGEEVYKALTPSTASFKGDGKVLCLSSPYAKYGAFWNRYVESFEEQDSTLMFQMYSALLNPEIDPVVLKTEKKRDKFSFMTEYAAKFADNVSAWIDDEKQLKACVNEKRPNISRGELYTEYFLGLDLASKNDGTAIAVGHKDSETNKIIIDYAEVFFSASSDVWDLDRTIYKKCDKYAGYEFIPMEQIVNEIEELCKWFPIRSGWFDQWNGYALLELLHSRGLTQFRMEQITEQMNTKMYGLFKSLLGEGMIELPNNQVLIDEIIALEAERKSKSGVKVRAPNKKGAHDDIADAVARVIWDVYHNNKERGEKLTGGTLDRRKGNVTMNTFKMNRNKMHGPRYREVQNKIVR